MMMAKFYGDYLKPALEGKPAKTLKGKSLPPLKAFIAQMSTGEGKSIVIAMLAIFMVKLHGMRVHVLENNEGLLERDYAVNKPFYDKFGIHSAKDLTDEEVPRGNTTTRAAQHPPGPPPPPHEQHHAHNRTPPRPPGDDRVHS